MGKQKSDAAAPKTAEVSELEALAVKLDALAAEATALGEEPLAKATARTARMARTADKRKNTRVKKFGDIIASLKAKGLSAEEIVEQLSGGEEKE